ncbi:hypothetical protein D3C85_1517450 [compost metagenome]
MIGAVGRAQADAVAGRHAARDQVSRCGLDPGDQFAVADRTVAVEQGGAVTLGGQAVIEGADGVPDHAAARSRMVTTVAASSPPRKPPPFSATAMRAPST